MKRLFALLLIILPAAMLVGCGDGGVHLDKNQVQAHQNRKDKLDGGGPTKSRADQ